MNSPMSIALFILSGDFRQFDFVVELGFKFGFDLSDDFLMTA